MIPGTLGLIAPWITSGFGAGLTCGFGAAFDEPPLDSAIPPAIPIASTPRTDSATVRRTMTWRRRCCRRRSRCALRSASSGSIAPGQSVMARIVRLAAVYAVANRCRARSAAFAASASRSFGGADVTSEESRRLDAAATSSTARAKASSFVFDGLVKPLIFRTYCSAELWTSSSVAGGAKL